MTDLPKVSIVIAYYKNLKDTDECLASLLKTNYSNFEVILVDNASNDGATEFFAKKYPQIIIAKNNANLGSTGAWNRGYTLINNNSKYVAFIDNDLTFDPEWLIKLVETIEKDSTIGGCQPKILHYWDPKKFDYNGSSGIWMDLYGYPINRGRVFYFIEEDKGQYQSTCETFFIGGSVCFIPTHILKETELFDESFFARAHEELDLSWRIRLAGYKLFCVPSSVVFHKSHMGSGKKLGSITLYMKHRNNVYMMIKNYSLKSLLRYIPFRFFLDLASLIPNGLAPIKAYFWIVKNFKLIWTHRVIVQLKIRKFSDKQVTSICILQPSPILSIFSGYKTWRDFLSVNPQIYNPVEY